MYGICIYAFSCNLKKHRLRRNEQFAKELYPNVRPTSSDQLVLNVWSAVVYVVWLHGAWTESLPLQQCISPQEMYTVFVRLLLVRSVSQYRHTKQQHQTKGTVIIDQERPTDRQTDKTLSYMGDKDIDHVACKLQHIPVTSIQQRHALHHEYNIKYIVHTAHGAHGTPNR